MSELYLEVVNSLKEVLLKITKEFILVIKKERN
jgi:hypothetical protein